MTDILVALITFLKADADVDALIDGRVYGEQVPQAEIERQEPRKFVVVTDAGGIERNRFLPIAQPRYDVWCYGETYHEAGNVDRAVYSALKALDRQPVGGVLLHNAGLAGGPMPVRDDKTGWPAKWRSITVQADERAIS